MPDLDTGQYVITNVKYGTIAILPDSKEKSYIVAQSDLTKTLGERWNITLVKTGHYTIQNYTYGSFVNSPPKILEGDKLFGGPIAQQWKIKETELGYSIFPEDIQGFFWGLQDSYNNTPITFGRVPNDTKFKWFFTKVGNIYGKSVIYWRERQVQEECERAGREERERMERERQMERLERELRASLECEFRERLEREFRARETHELEHDERERKERGRRGERGRAERDEGERGEPEEQKKEGEEWKWKEPEERVMWEQEREEREETQRERNAIQRKSCDELESIECGLQDRKALARLEPDQPPLEDGEKSLTPVLPPGLVGSIPPIMQAEIQVHSCAEGECRAETRDEVQTVQSEYGGRAGTEAVGLLTRRVVQEDLPKYDYLTVAQTEGDMMEPKVYKNLVSLFLFSVSRISELHGADLLRVSHQIQRCLPSVSQSELVLCLSESPRFRLHLLEFFSLLGTRHHPETRDALSKDEAQLQQVVKTILTCHNDKQSVLQLRDVQAEGFIDFIDTVLYSSPPWDRNTYRDVRRLSIRLLKASDVIPSSLLISGVEKLEQEAVAGGGFADIFLAIHGQNQVALKRLRVFASQNDQVRNRIRSMLRKEALLWKHLQHPNVLPFLGIDLETFPGFLCMVSPWMKHGTILKYISRHGLRYVNVERLVLDIVQGIEYVHAQQFIHGDLRGVNILVDELENARIADFGLASFAEVTQTSDTSRGGSTIRWMAPELIQPETYHFPCAKRTRATDVYAFGCVCLEMYTGSYPFSEIPNEATVLLQLMNGARPTRPSSSTERAIPDTLWGIMERCWSQNISSRPSMGAVVDEWGAMVRVSSGNRASGGLLRS